MIRRVVFAMFVVGVLAQQASAQQASKVVYPTPQAPAVKPDLADVPPPPPKPVEASKSSATGQAAAKRSIARLKPLPQRTSANQELNSIARLDLESTQGRYANPGGVGRFAEYYTANTLASRSDFRPAPPARFGGGGVPNRGSQIASFQAGQMRARNIQDNINVYGRPYGAYGAGFGFGFGLATGGLYGGGLR